MYQRGGTHTRLDRQGEQDSAHVVNYPENGALSVSNTFHPVPLRCDL